MGDPLRLYGLKALVSNAGSGIGEAIARTLAKHGADVLAVDTENSGVEQHFDAVKGVYGFAVNFMDAQTFPEIAAKVQSALGGLDILCNDMPLAPQSPFTGNTHDYQQLLELRQDFMLGLTRALLPKMQTSPAGRIINLGFLRSVFAAEAFETFAHSERNLASLTRKLSLEASAHGLNANYLQPGAVMTPTSREVFRRNPGLRDHFIQVSAAKRVGEPVDVAKAALFLASDDAVFVSGAGVRVDGGSDES